MIMKNLIAYLYSSRPFYLSYEGIRKHLDASSKRVNSLFKKIYHFSVNVKDRIKEYVVTTLPKMKVYVIDIFKALTGKFRSIYDLIKEYTIGVQGYYDPINNRIVLDEESVYKNPSIIDHENIHKAQDELLKSKGYSLKGILRKYGDIGRAYIEGWAEYLVEKIYGKMHSPYEKFKELYKKIVQKYGSEKRVLENLDNSVIDFRIFFI